MLPLTGNFLRRCPLSWAQIVGACYFLIQHQPCFKELRAVTDHCRSAASDLIHNGMAKAAASSLQPSSSTLIPPLESMRLGLLTTDDSHRSSSTLRSTLEPKSCGPSWIRRRVLFFSFCVYLWHSSVNMCDVGLIFNHAMHCQATTLTSPCSCVKGINNSAVETQFPVTTLS